MSRAKKLIESALREQGSLRESGEEIPHEIAQFLSGFGFKLQMRAGWGGSPATFSGKARVNQQKLMSLAAQASRLDQILDEAGWVGYFGWQYTPDLSSSSVATGGGKSGVLFTKQGQAMGAIGSKYFSFHGSPAAADWLEDTFETRRVLTINFEAGPRYVG